MIRGGIIINKPIKVKKVVCKATILTLEEKLKNTICRHENTASDLLYSFFQYINIFGLANHLGGFYRFVYGDHIPNQDKNTYK